MARNIDLSYGWDISLDPATNNLRTVEGSSYTTQKIKQVLQVFFGEWYLNLDQGYPYFDLLLGQVRPDITAARAYMVTIIMAVPGVSSVDTLDISIDNASETAIINFTCTLSDGTVVTDTVIS